jgi:hypothetical protein
LIFDIDKSLIGSGNVCGSILFLTSVSTVGGIMWALGESRLVKVVSYELELTVLMCSIKSDETFSAESCSSTCFSSVGGCTASIT